MARTELARRETEAAAFEARIAEFKAAKDDMAGRFREVAGTLLGEAQKAFLERADERFRQSEESAGQGLKALLQPVTERLQRYEEGVAKVEAERRDAFGSLYGQIEAMRVGQESVRAEAQKLVNALRAAPKARGRWGEQQPATCWRRAASPNMPISRWRSASPATTASGCAPTRWCACLAASRW